MITVLKNRAPLQSLITYENTHQSCGRARIPGASPEKSVNGVMQAGGDAFLYDKASATLPPSTGRATPANAALLLGDFASPLVSEDGH